MTKRIIVTGGSGTAGQHIITYLLSQGHDILNIDLAPLPNPALASQVHTLRADLTSSGQTYNALTSHFHLTEPFREPLHQLPDAVIHLAGHARNMIVPDNETFRVNALSMYNIIEASCRLGIKKLILASSITVYGVSFAEGDIDFPSFPVTEEVDANPMDTYAISKLCGERIARGFARRFGADIYVLRLGRVIEPHEYMGPMFRSYVREPEKWRVHGWSYIDVRDLGQICHLAVGKDGLGFQIFNVVNDTITNEEETGVFLRRVCPDTPVTREMGVREAPICNLKVRRLLGFREGFDWRMFYEE
ncbi:NAD(P)-binding protein [Aspergillus sclerotioniger CBS 115572]|uniref:NAD(P)-binding protein n=1 Tax=Aspergillus sclerotioniger CBS 115572 TaxID=1450535 RepID=A0A317WBS1_9EURO|nr:NAD(P)-binding protein [Aspergillus sclerotioniger CBS 115572]PWY81580.1 NAD(P)-binding protein [Aspergillus sclerotioniger CBS 115572]